MALTKKSMYKPRFTINVNSQNKEWTEKTISYEQLVQLAYPGSTRDDYSATFHGKREEGTLYKGKTIEVEEAMVFNIVLTNAA